jgi:hypothetical protein
MARINGRHRDGRSLSIVIRKLFKSSEKSKQFTSSADTEARHVRNQSMRRYELSSEKIDERARWNRADE